jgi:molybdopterin molybdotransferase
MMRSMERLFAIRDGVVGAVEPVSAEDVLLAAGLGRYLAADALARVDAPPHTCSAMDGYAVRAADVAGPSALRVALTIYAGDVPARPLAAGEAARIFTGATLPSGADAVVREEATRPDGERVRVLDAARPGENVRRAGEDVAQGAPALAAGTRIGARQAALLAAVGVESLSVHRRPRIAILSTGDEVVSGRTPDSNGTALEALVTAIGALPVRSAVGDRLDAVGAALSSGIATCDAVVTVGGVSIGERDHVPAALASLGADIRVHGVPMKPGKPFLFALARGKPVLGLPGSPSACLVAFEVFARPALLALAGAARRDRTAIPVRLAEPAAGKPGRARLLWARVGSDGRATPVGRDAAQVRGPALADALLLVPAGAGDLPPGSEVLAWLLDDDAPGVAAALPAAP